MGVSDPQNAALIRVAEKAGMSYEREVMLEGYGHPDRVYSVLNPARRWRAGGPRAKRCGVSELEATRGG